MGAQEPPPQRARELIQILIHKKMVARECGQPFFLFLSVVYYKGLSGNRVVSEETGYLTTSGRKSGGLR